METVQKQQTLYQTNKYIVIITIKIDVTCPRVLFHTVWYGVPTEPTMYPVSGWQSHLLIY